MAAETILGIAVPEFASHRLFQRVGSQAFVADCRLKSTSRWVIANQAFVETSVALEHPSLHALTKCPANGDRKDLRSVADCVDTLVALGCNCVDESPLVDGQHWVRFERRVFAGKQ